MAGKTPTAILAIARTLKPFAKSKDFQSALGMSGLLASVRTTGQRRRPKKGKGAASATAT